MDNQYNQIVDGYKKKLADKLDGLKQQASDPGELKQKTDEIVLELTKEATEKVTKLFDHNMKKIKNHIGQIKEKLTKEADKHHKKQLDDLRMKIKNQ